MKQEYLLIREDILGSILKSKSMGKVLSLLLDGDISFKTYDELSKRLGLKTRSASYKIINKLITHGVIEHILSYNCMDNTEIHYIWINNRVFI